MPTAVGDRTVIAWLHEAQAAVSGRADYLTQLDAAIGDGDHGINMTRGFDAVGKALAAQGPDTAPGRRARAGRQDAGRRPSAEPAVRSGARRFAPRGAASATPTGSTARDWPPRSTRRWTRSSTSAPPSPATRRWSTRWRPPRRRCASASTRAARWRRRSRPRPMRPRPARGDHADAGPQGSRVVPGRALHRSQDPGATSAALIMRALRPP